RNSISATTEPASYDAVWPGMVRACGNKDGRERHRIGQTRPVTYNVAVAANTIDDSMWSMILDKQQVLDAVLVGIETDDTDETTTAAAQLAWQLTQTGLTRIDTTTA
ncbi:MAG TPA: hypothetical protein VFC16_04510, partial [Nakamurella sp.]|nr:hypothetical protein [Nakamurella sp.]